MLAPGSRVGGFEIERQLGVGGMATVYLARHADGTACAIKVLDSLHREDVNTRRRFYDEARIQYTHGDHPNILKVTAIVATDEHAALVMELVDGGSLEDHLPRLRTRPDEIRQIMLGVLAGVGHAHALGIIHRDLKPDNVLLQRDGEKFVPKVADFGIAKVPPAVSGPGKQLTRATARMGALGTVHYMSPEHLRYAKDVTSRSDIWSLGVMLYELATGALPFDDKDHYVLIEQVLRGRYLPPEQREPRIDPAVAAVIRKALQFDPAQRFATCEEMATALCGGALPGGWLAPVPASLSSAVPAPADPSASDAVPVDTGDDDALTRAIGGGRAALVDASVPGDQARGRAPVRDAGAYTLRASKTWTTAAALAWTTKRFVGAGVGAARRASDVLRLAGEPLDHLVGVPKGEKEDDSQG